MSKICVLLALQRSGTQALGSLFNQHPDLLYLSEVFYAGPKCYEHKNNYAFFLLKKMKEDCIRYMYFQDQSVIFDEYLDYLKSLYPQKKIILDIKYNSTHLFNGGWHFPTEIPKMLKFLVKKNIPIIHLKRNIFRIYISELVAKKINVWHFTKDEETNIKLPKIKVNKKEMVNYIKLRYDSMLIFERFLKFYPNKLDIKYEDLFSVEGLPNRDTLVKIMNFLKVNVSPDLNFEPAFKKLITDYKEIVENWEEVIDYLKKFSWFAELEKIAGSINS